MSFSYYILKMNLMICSPQNKLIYVPITKKGPNAIVDPLNFFFPNKISMIESAAPVKKAT